MLKLLKEIFIYNNPKIISAMSIKYTTTGIQCLEMDILALVKSRTKTLILKFFQDLSLMTMAMIK